MLLRRLFILVSQLRSSTVSSLFYICPVPLHIRWILHGTSCTVALVLCFFNNYLQRRSDGFMTGMMHGWMRGIRGLEGSLKRYDALFQSTFSSVILPSLSQFCSLAASSQLPLPLIPICIWCSILLVSPVAFFLFSSLSAVSPLCTPLYNASDIPLLRRYVQIVPGWRSRSF